MKPIVVIGVSIAYLALLFVIAYWADKQAKRGKSWVNNSLVYALSLAVFCTAWTFYGSVGRATTSGIGFLPIFLGPTIMAPLWIFFFRKLILISKYQRITSVADFISSRYGKSTWLGAGVSVLAVVGVLPYISLQLKAIGQSFQTLLTNGDQTVVLDPSVPFYQETAFYVALVLGVFAILFGTRNLDPNERHEGLVAAIAFESIFKILAFLIIGVFVTYFVFNGWGDLFGKGFEQPSIRALFDMDTQWQRPGDWFWLLVLSMLAFLFLPRQFHVGVVENNDPRHLDRAAWLVPLYLLLINLFVLPIALAGLLLFPEGTVNPDLFVLRIPLLFDHDILALIVALGGFSAAAGMVIVAVIALSIMISNNLVLPVLLRSKTITDVNVLDLSSRLLGIRRVIIVVVMLLAYGYFRSIAQQYNLVSIGLLSFAAIAQLGPAILGGMYWKQGTKIGAALGIGIGFLVWMYTLALPVSAESGMFSTQWVESGPWGITWLRPYGLFGMDTLEPVAHAAFWSLLFNIGAYFFGSLATRPSLIEISQADIFVDIYKYESSEVDYQIMRRQARVEDVFIYLQRFLGVDRAISLVEVFNEQFQTEIRQEQWASTEFINYAERHLAGAIGAASAKLLLRSIVKDDPISLGEVFGLLEQTREIIAYSKALEKKSEELELTTRQLVAANEQLQQLDRLKADFITTVTHELRTPITSIKALSRILLDNNDLPAAQQQEFLGILVDESGRIARLINQVLDLEKIQSTYDPTAFQPVAITEVCERAFQGLQQLMQENQLEGSLQLPVDTLCVKGNPDRLTQVVVNLVANAIKFARSKVILRLTADANQVRIEVEDDGIGISRMDQQLIFQQFTQVSHDKLGKPKGSGLGLYITQRIVDHHGGTIGVESELDKGACFWVTVPRIKGC
jgi:Na+/proline symporter/nitrogen-specific signal transduction histidine kinase